MSSSSFSPSSSSTASSTPTTGTGGSGTPATSTLLFGFLVIFAALLAAFVFLMFFWKSQQRRRRALEPEVDEIGGVRGVPKLWEVWVRDEPSENQPNWESTSPLSIDVDRVPSEEAISSARRPWPYGLFRRRAVPPPPPSSSQAQQQQPDGPDAEAIAGLISGGLRVSFVIAMPQADAPERRRSQISRASQVVEQQNWQRRGEYAIGIYHPSFREGWTL